MEEIKIAQFREKLELAGYSKRSIKDYPYEVGRFFQYLEENENIDIIDKITSKHITGYHTYVQYTKTPRGTYRSTATVRRLMGAVKSFYHIMHREKLIARDYGSCIRLPKRKKHLPRHVPNQKQMKDLVHAIVPRDPITVRDRALVELLYATGLRSAEVRTLRIDDYDLREQTLFVCGKGSRERIVPVGSWVVPHLREYLHSSRPLLASKNIEGTDLLFISKNGRKITEGNLCALLDKYARAAGIGHISPHTIRHACATHLLQCGADIRWVQELLGHSDLASTQIYTRVDITDLKRAHRRYHPRERQNHEA